MGEAQEKRTIDHTGRLFRYAYWFRPPSKRPGAVDEYNRPVGSGTISLCRLFWRVLLITFIAMPIWWLVWAPAMTVLGFLFARRPRFFESDWAYSPLYDVVLAPYRRWLRIRGVRIFPVWVILGGLFLWDLVIVNPGHLKYVAGILGIAAGVLTLIAIIFGAIPAAKAKVLETEPGRLAKDWVKAKKARVCPLYKVV